MPPTGLKATPGNAQASLTWSSSSGASSYHLKRGTLSGGPYADIATAMSPSYTDATVTNGTTYYYVVTAVDPGGESGNSAQASVTPDPSIATPAVPMSLRATAGNAQASLTWSASSGASSYHVKRATTSGGPYTQIGAPSSTSYDDTSLTNGTTYYYVVSALDSAGESANSAQVSAMPVAPPAAPSTPTALSASPGNTQVSLTWSASSGAAGYHVKRATTSGGPYTQVGAPTATSYIDTSLTNGTTYYYVVSAVYSSAESPDSAQVSATPVAPAPHVGTCNGLAAPGQWQEITPPGVTLQAPYGGVLVTLVDPNNSGTIYATTYQNGMYKSTDCGATWVKTNTGRNGSMIDGGRIWSAVIDPVNSQTIYLLTGYGPSGVWKSTNGGVDFTNIGPNVTGVPGFIERIGLDPTNHLHLLVIFHENCTSPYNPFCIAQSMDGGNTWSILNLPTSIASSWGEGWFLDPLDATHWLLQASVLYYTADGGTTWSGIVSPSNVGNIQGPPYQDPSGKLWLASTQGTIFSTNNGASWTQVQNSGGDVDGVTGCGNSLYSVVGFQPPQNSNYVYTATFADPTAWSVLPTPGFPQTMISGANSIVCDDIHGIVYVAAQAAGLWRMATGVSN
jgi:fibronectin type 3 domain-containing protein